MKVVILCGGKGSRLIEMTDVVPKPMLPVGGRPLLHHIIDIYRHYGNREFVLPVGHKKEHIIAYLLSMRPESMIKVGDGEHLFTYKDFKVTAVDTGEETQTGGRLRRVRHLLEDGPFHFTYGDGLSNVNLDKVELTHFMFENVATLTLVHPDGRFGRAVVQEDGLITEFGEKTETSDWINGGFAVLHPEIFTYVDDDNCNLEREVYPFLAKSHLMIGYRHDGFWKCVDTKRDLLELDEIYNQGGAEWPMLP